MEVTAGMQSVSARVLFEAFAGTRQHFYLHTGGKVAYDSRMAKRTKGKISLGCLFWVLFILLMAALFIFNKDTIIHVLEKTNAKSILTGKKAETGQTADSLPEIQLKDDTEADAGSKAADVPGNAEHHEAETPLQDGTVYPNALETEAPELSQFYRATNGRIVCRANGNDNIGAVYAGRR